MSSNTIFRGRAVKYRSLASTKSEQKRKIYRMINNSSHGMYTGRSPFSFKKKEEKKEDANHIWATDMWWRNNSLLSIKNKNTIIRLWKDPIYTGCCGDTRPTLIAKALTYLLTSGLKSEKGMSSSETSTSRAPLAAESAAEFSLMPTWPCRNPDKNDLLPISVSSKIFAGIERSYFMLDIARRDGRESDRIRKDFSWEW